jgi:DNA-binding NtrC family response regulator
MPVGQKSLARHEIMFGGKGATTVPRLGSKPLILIADDDRRARMVFRIRIEEAGYEAVECGTGDEAWERIRQGGVALAVLDMKMPGLHGLEVLSNISDKCPGLPVVICTAYDQLREEYAVKTFPNLRYLVKPIAPQSLVEAIGELLAPKNTA